MKLTGSANLVSRGMQRLQAALGSLSFLFQHLSIADFIHYAVALQTVSLSATGAGG
jgi:hypothetical protein